MAERSCLAYALCMGQLTLYASAARRGEYVLIDRSTGQVVEGPFRGDPDPRRVMDGLAIVWDAPIELELVPDVRAVLRTDTEEHAGE